MQLEAGKGAYPFAALRDVLEIWVEGRSIVRVRAEDMPSNLVRGVPTMFATVGPWVVFWPSPDQDYEVDGRAKEQVLENCWQIVPLEGDWLSRPIPKP